MVTTYTASNTDTYTIARAKYVLGKVYEDLIGLYQANLIKKEICDKWRDDLLYIIENRALDYFQFQLIRSDNTEIGGLHYVLDATGNIYTDDRTGGIDYWGLPSNTRVKLLVSLAANSSKTSEVNAELERRGWGSGNPLSGTAQYMKSYSREGFGFKQSKIGEW